MPSNWAPHFADGPRKERDLLKEKQGKSDRQGQDHTVGLWEDSGMLKSSVTIPLSQPPLQN